jgi:hypothetical protein
VVRGALPDRGATGFVLPCGRAAAARGAGGGPAARRLALHPHARHPHPVSPHCYILVAFQIQYGFDTHHTAGPGRPDLTRCNAGALQGWGRNNGRSFCCLCAWQHCMSALRCTLRTLNTSPAASPASWLPVLASNRNLHARSHLDTVTTAALPVRRCFYHWGFTLLPGTLWLAWVLSGWRRRGAHPNGAWTRPATRGGAPAPFTVLQVCCARALATLSCTGSRTSCQASHCDFLAGHMCVAWHV